MTPTNLSVDTTSTRPRVLFFGATGYIGGSVLGRLIQHPAGTSYDIVAYLRKEDKAKVLVEQLRINAIIGTLEDSDKIENAAADADIVIHTAESADHIGSVQAILRGLKKKHLESGNLPIYIHTVSVLS
jgi:nucleoside-diphosphate-sugar epimerase